METLKTQLWLSQSLEEVWEFHKDIHNLVKISPDFLKLSLVNLPEKIEKGASFEIRSNNKFFKNFLKWSVEYIDWHEEADLKYFIDLQKEGPFNYWKHKHEFRRGPKELLVDEKKFTAKNEGTWIVDTLEYELKPQLKGFTWVAEKMITQLFVFRKRRLEKIFRR